MDAHGTPHTTIPYPPDAPPGERLMLKAMATCGILLLAAIVSTMGLCMYLLPGAPPNVPLPLF